MFVGKIQLYTITFKMKSYISYDVASDPIIINLKQKRAVLYT